MPRKSNWGYGQQALGIMGGMMMMSRDLYGMGNPYGYNGKYDRDERPQTAEEKEAAKARSDAKVEAARLKREKKNAKRLKNRQS